MTVKELIQKLNSLNPDAKVLVDIMQENKSYGIFQLDPHMVDATYSGATIRVWLPSGSFITQKEKALTINDCPYKEVITKFNEIKNFIMTKKLELISRNDIDGKWFIVRLSVEGQSNKDLFKRNEQEAINAFTEAHKNLSILGDEVVLKSETYPPAKVEVEKAPEKPKVRKVYISTDTGECYESIPDGHTGSFVDIVTNAPFGIIETAFIDNLGLLGISIRRILGYGYHAERSTSFTK